MRPIRTVLSPVGFSEAGLATLDLAARLCAATGARLVAHHNVGTVPPGAAAVWMWDEEHRAQLETPEGAERQLREWIERVAPAVDSELAVTTGGLGQAVLRLAETVPADVIVFALHDQATPEEEELAERLIDGGPCPVLAFHLGRRLPAFRSGAAEPVVTLVATDFGPEATEAVAEAFDLARQVALTLHLLHADPKAVTGERVGEDRARLEGLVPPELKGRVVVHVARQPAAEAIVGVAERVGASLIIMGEHARTLLRRLFTTDTARAVLRRAPCAVWFAAPRPRR